MLRHKVNGLAFWRWFMKHLLNTGKQTFILGVGVGVGGMVNRPRVFTQVNLWSVLA